MDLKRVEKDGLFRGYLYTLHGSCQQRKIFKKSVNPWYHWADGQIKENLKYEGNADSTKLSSSFRRLLADAHLPSIGGVRQN